MSLDGEVLCQLQRTRHPRISEADDIPRAEFKIPLPPTSELNQIFASLTVKDSHRKRPAVILGDMPGVPASDLDEHRLELP